MRNRFSPKGFAGAAALVALLFGSNAWAAGMSDHSSSRHALLNILLQNGTITQAQYETLASKARVESEQDSILTAQSTKPDAVVKTKNFTIDVGGRAQTDAGFFNSDKTALGDGQELRRARVDISGGILENWAYKISIDFSSSNELKYANLSYKGFEDTAITIGYFKTPFSLEYQTSSKHTEFQERSMLHGTFDPDTRIGLGVARDGALNEGEYTAAVGIFGEAYPSDTDKEGDSGVGLAGRTSYAFTNTDDSLLHFGVSGEVRSIGDGEDVRQRARPGAHLAPRFIDTGAIPGVDNSYKVGGELAAVRGPLAVQAQYTAQSNQRDGSDLFFDGWYAQASYFLTQDSRAAAYSGGRFGSIKPNGNYGAWQVAMRYDTVDLNDEGFVGGQQTNLAAALNWYVNKYVRFSINYINVLDLDRAGSAHDNDEPNLFIARTWFYF